MKTTTKLAIPIPIIFGTIIALTIVFASPFWGDGRGSAQANEPGSGNALNFDGQNDWVQVPNNVNLNFGTSDFSYSCWFRIDNTSTAWRQIISKRDNTADYEIQINPSGVIRCYVGTCCSFETTTNFYASIGKWHHIAFVRLNGTGSIYVDGILDATMTSGGANVSSNNPLILGRDGLLTSEFFNGQIDEIRIWNYARSQTQIREGMCRKLTGSEPGLVGYWRMDEGSGNTAFDSSPNNNDGTLY